MDKAVSGITFREDFDAWWPDYDHKPEKCLGFVRRGLADMDHAVALCGRRRRVCVQAGGHAGLWARRLAGLFERVLAFEPEPALYECMRRNLEHWGVTNVSTSRLALSDRAGRAAMRPHVSAGSWAIDPAGTFEVECATVDGLHMAGAQIGYERTRPGYALSAGLAECDAIFLDVEGHEPAALRGAAGTIERLSPVVHVEVLPRAAGEIRSTLAGMGYSLRARAHGDEIYAK